MTLKEDINELSGQSWFFFLTILFFSVGSLLFTNARIDNLQKDIDFPDDQAIQVPDGDLILHSLGYTEECVDYNYTAIRTKVVNLTKLICSDKEICSSSATCLSHFGDEDLCQTMNGCLLLCEKAFENNTLKISQKLPICTKFNLVRIP